MTKKTTAAFPNQLSSLSFSFFRKFANGGGGGGGGARVKIARGAVLLHRLAGRPSQKGEEISLCVSPLLPLSPARRTNGAAIAQIQ